jgi:hypothetical protein
MLLNAVLDGIGLWGSWEHLQQIILKYDEKPLIFSELFKGLIFLKSLNSETVCNSLKNS